MRALLLLVLFLTSSPALAIAGYLQNGQCFKTYDEAISVRFKDTFALSPADVLFSFQKVGNAWQIYVHQMMNNGNLSLKNVYPLPVINFSTCELEDTALVNSITNPTPSEIAFVFSWGFGVVLFFWSLGFGISAAITTIKKL